jgi:hypothetical protein
LDEPGRHRHPDQRIGGIIDKKPQSVRRNIAAGSFVTLTTNLIL